MWAEFMDELRETHLGIKRISPPYAVPKITVSR